MNLDSSITTYIAILGRQPALGVAELERLFGSANVRRVNDSVALFSTNMVVPFGLIGGTVKLGTLLNHKTTQNYQAASREAANLVTREYASFRHKLTLGISSYGFDIGPRDAQKTGLIIKGKLKAGGVSVRLVPNTDAALSSAQSYHNGLISENKIELLLVRGDDGESYIGLLYSVQDIDAYTERDRSKPHRDALNGMLPPKLAQTMINLAVGPSVVSDRDERRHTTLLDPFCGSGTILIEAIFHGFDAYGTDLNPKMVAHSKANIDWFQRIFAVEQPSRVRIEPADATTTTWTQPFGTIASETYLGEPMSQIPKPEKLALIMQRCDDVARGFLTNLAGQLPSGFELCIAVPAWRIGSDTKHLPVVDDLAELGYNWIDFEHVNRSDLLYFREDQIVARELLVIKKG